MELLLKVVFPGLLSLLAYCGYKAYYMKTDIGLSLCKLDKEYFKDKLVWITGASSGIGEALSFELASYGAKLVLSARNTNKLNKIKKTLRNNYKLEDKDIMILPMDLSKRTTQKAIYESLYQQILSFFNRKSVDILINNAGIAHDGLTDEIPYDDIYDIYNINLISPSILTRTVLPDMLSNDFGHIINISSVTSYFHNGAMSIYAATKNALNSLSRVLQTEMAFINYNVNCTLCILGAINTGIDKRTKNIDGGIGSDAWTKWGIIENGISPQQCAQLICTATSNKMNEVWISKQPQLFYLYAIQQFPNLHAYGKKLWMKIGFPPFMDRVYKRRQSQL